MATIVSICNVALQRIGVNDYIESIDDDDAPAEACNVAFEGLRDLILSEYPWPFATKRNTPTALDGVTREGWSFAFSLPSDCLTVQEIYPLTRQPQLAAKIPYKLEANDAGSAQLLLCDLEEPTIIYTARITAASMWSAAFADALAWFIARDIATPLKARLELRDRAERTAELWLARARAKSANESHEHRTEAFYIDARG